MSDAAVSLVLVFALIAAVAFVAFRIGVMVTTLKFRNEKRNARANNMDLLEGRRAKSSDAGRLS